MIMVKKICLDAGHYGKYNRSPADSAYYESEMNWKLHLKLKKELESYGFKVVTTRSNQSTDLDLVKRGKTSEGCDFFLSLHSNSTGNGKVNEDVDHIVIYSLVDDNTTSIDEKSKDLAKKLAPVITKVMGVSQKEYRIATSKSSNDRNGDGIKNDNYYGVLHGARLVNTPALIVEHSFHTNTRSTKWLLDDGNLDKLAKAEAEVIADYFGVKKTETIYRVQIGAYLLKKNGENMLKKVKSAGYNGFITKSGLYYKVQVGSFSNKTYADRLAKELKNKGFSTCIAKATV